MNATTTGSRKRNAWAWRLALAIAVSLAALAAMATRGGLVVPQKVHEAAFVWAQEHPGRNVPVIVQTSGQGDAVAAIDAAGGIVQRQFEIIPALEAEIPASGLTSLSQDSSVAWVSLDAPVVSTGFIDFSNLASVYPFAVNAPSVWNAATPRTGQGVGVAVVDSGVSNASNPDFQDVYQQSRFAFEVAVSSNTTNVDDGYGHGTHVAGIVGGDGDLLKGRYIGIAPEASLIDVKISDDIGAATLSDALAGIQWAVDNKDLYNIRVLNLSLQSSVAESYKTDPLDAAVEFAWMRGLVVVAAAGNSGTAADAVSYAPANDPFVIVVGATDDMGTPTRDDDVVAFFSSRGTTQDGFTKPDLVAPGRRIVADINPNSILAQLYPDRFVDQFYFRMSGTSMAAPVVSGIVALMLEQNPALTPGQVKYVLMKTAQQLPSDSSGKTALADAAVFYSGELPDANASLSPGRQVRMNFIAKIALFTHVLGAPDPAAEAALVGLDLGKAGLVGANLDNVDWEAIKWGAIKWDAIKWSAIQWDAIKWAAVKWDLIKWDAVKWSAVKWGAVKWDAIKWSAIKWDAIKWGAVKWDAVTNTDATLTGVEFKSSQFDSTHFDSATGFDAYFPTSCPRQQPRCK
ncbi:MAG: S8 family peptidase [Chloroflexi bacterium]|nr:S8 family peptidase [Chloroflexota bacterium]